MHVSTLGELRLTEPAGLDQQQSLALLAYLALEGPKSRRHLASFFWGDKKAPLNNVSSALSRIRQRAPGALVIDGSTVGANLTTDVELLLAAIAEGNATGIIEHYRGHFFELAELRSVGLELEEWIFTTRESLARSASGALLAAAEEARADGRMVVVGNLAEAAYRIGQISWHTSSPWNRCHRLLLAANRPLSDRLVVEAADYGIELSADSSHPFEVSAPDTATRPEPGRSGDSAEFVGRAAELATLREFVDQADPVWLSVVGLGGIGKTTLVRSTYRELLGGSTPVAWIAAASLNSVDDVAESLAAELGMSFSDTTGLVAEIASAVQPTGLVLIFDNLEQVEFYESLLAELAALPHVRVIATSRRRTNHPQERILDLRGLEPAGAGLDLFVARGSVEGLTVPEDLEGALKVCELVDGMPLALELCAGWLRTIPLSALTAALEDSSELTDVSPRGELETIDSVFERSWNFLEPRDADSLLKLSAFHGPFSYDAARVVAGVSLVTIASLTDRSLVQSNGDTLDLHPLVRQKARQKWETRPDPERLELAERFVDYYRDLLLSNRTMFRTDDGPEAVATIGREFVNVQAAWLGALDSENWDATYEMADALDQYLKRGRRHRLGFEMFAHASATSQGRPEGAAQRACVEVSWRAGWLQLMLGDIDAAVQYAGIAEQNCPADYASGRVAIARVEGQIAVFHGSYEEAAVRFREAGAAVDPSVDPWLLAEVKTGLGMCANAVGDLDEARDAFRSVLDTGRRLGDPALIANAYYSLGAVEVPVDPAQALVLLEEGLEVVRSVDIALLARRFAALIGRSHLRLDNAEAAYQVFADVLSTDEDDADQELWTLASNQTGMGMTCHLLGRSEEARRWFLDALRVVTEIQDWPMLLEVMLEICRMGPPVGAEALHNGLLGLVIAHPASVFEWRDEARELLADLGDGTDPVELESSVRLDVAAEAAIQLLRA